MLGYNMVFTLIKSKPADLICRTWCIKLLKLTVVITKQEESRLSIVKTVECRRQH